MTNSLPLDGKSLKEKRVIYRLKTHGCYNPVLLYGYFDTREKAESFAKFNVSIRPEINWKDVYEIIEEQLYE